MANDWDKVPKWAREQYARVVRERNELLKRAQMEAAGGATARIQAIDMLDDSLTRGFPDHTPVRFVLDKDHSIDIRFTFEGDRPGARPTIEVSSRDAIIVSPRASNLIRVGSEDR